MQESQNYANTWKLRVSGPALKGMRGLVSQGTSVLMWILCLGVWRGVTPGAQARVHRVVVESREPDKESAKAKVPYERIRGLAYGEVDPRDPRNAIIQDIALAPRNARGRVEYIATFTLLQPIDRSQISGLLLYEVVNRGASILPRDLSKGDVFLSSGWQGDLPFRGKSVYGTDAETIQLPIAHNEDGSAVTGTILLRFANVPQGTHSVSTRSAMGYASSGPPPLPVDLDTTHASLTSRSIETVTGVAGGVQTISGTDWSWGDCSESPFPGKPDPNSICLREGFDPNRLYQLAFTGKDPIVLGVGLAAMRDVVAFFHHAEKDESGAANPIAGAVQYTIGRGASQSGNLIRTFLNLGFNEDEDGRRVFDGVMPTIAARQIPINIRFGVPGGASSLYEPGSDGPVWWTAWPDEVRHQKTAGLLDRCRHTNTCPLIVEALGSSEFWTLRASPDFVGTDNKRDIPLPSNVRRYYIASTQHGGGVGGFRVSLPPENEGARRSPLSPLGCVLPANPNPTYEIERALLFALKEWVVKGVEPPPSRYPKLADGTLFEANSAAMHFPVVPGLPQPDGVVNPLLVYDFGSAFNARDLSGVVATEPPAITNVISPLVPRVDADGNEVGGIHTVLQQAALGTYLGWNVTSLGFFKGQYCSLRGAFLPFPSSRTERESSHDPRLSLEERYGTHEGFVCAVTRSAEELVKGPFLLREDADRIIMGSRMSDVLTERVKPTDEDLAIAKRQCSNRL